jgi:MSHA biogenesis protein MshL
VTADLKEVTLAEALEALLLPLGLEYRMQGDRVRVYAPGLVTRTFQLHYLDVDRQGDSSLTISAGGGDAGTGVGGEASSTIRRSVRVNMWEEVERGLQMVAQSAADAGDGGDARVVVNRQAGTVLVTASPPVVRKIAAYLEGVQAAIGRQVMIEAKIIEVQLADAYSMGVDWAAIPALAGGLTGALSGGLADALAEPPSLAQGLAGSSGAFRFGATSHDLAVLLDAISTQGQVRVLSSPRIATLNNQPAVIKVAQEQTFFSLERETTNQDGVREDIFTVDKEKFTIGIVLDIIPRIADDGTVVMAVHPSITEFVEEKLFPPNASAQEILANAPVLDVREIDTVVRLRDSETLVIAGLMRQEDRERIESVPLLGDIPFLGALFRRTEQEQRNSELVIFLTPHVADRGTALTAPSSWADRSPTYHLGGKAARFGVAAEREIGGWR